MIAVKVPLRVSLAGGGTDFSEFYERYGGRVVSFAIDKYVYVIVKERYDDLIVLNYTQHEIVTRVEDIKHDLIRECMAAVGVFSGVEISTLADIPSSGTGLGSSSAITIGLLLALYTYIGESKSQRELAERACYIEINKLRHPIGKQDQYACAFGGLNSIEFRSNVIDIDTFDKDYYDIADNLFLHYTGITRDANYILAEQKKNTSDNTDSLLRLKAYAEDTHDALTLKDYDKIGEIIGLSWGFKSSLAIGISNRKIHKTIDYAYSCGAKGCKITGAGGGGYLLSYVPSGNRAVFKQKMCDLRELPFRIDQYGARVIFNIS